jgi:hypothetical protein
MTGLFGYTHLATSMHKGNVGIRTGSTPRAAGKVHLFDERSGRTACGRARNALVVSLVPDRLTEQNWHVRVPMCSVCLKSINK